MPFRRCVRLLVRSLSLFAGLAAVARGAVWTVDDDRHDRPDADFTAIQAAIDGAADGDEVVVYPGVYLERIAIAGKNLRLRSTAPDDSNVILSTVINGTQSGSVVVLDGGVTSATLIEGFTLTGGRALQGGGIFGGGGSATIRRNTIRANSADDSGGALYACNGLIEANTMTANSAEIGGAMAQCHGVVSANNIVGNGAVSGGGAGFCFADFSKNIIADNAAQDQGGGLYRCFGLTEKNQILRNRAANAGGGLALCGGTISENRIAENTALSGGGIYGGMAPIRDNTIEKNQAAGNGGGLDLCGGAISGNTISGNSAVVDGGGIADCVNATITENQILQNVAGGQGGGVAHISGVLRANVFSANRADLGGAAADVQGIIDADRLLGNVARRGGGLWKCDGTIQNSAAVANRAERGAGMDSCQGTIQNNTLAFNAGPEDGDGGTSPTLGAAIYFEGTGAVLRDNIFHRNAGAALAAATFDQSPSRLFIENNLFFDPDHPVAMLTGSGAVYGSVHDLEAGYPNSSGNLDADPLFADPAGPDGDPFAAEDDDLHLQAGSPAIDASTHDVMALTPVRDLDGLSRFVNLRADLGCFEFGGGADADGDGLPDATEAMLGLNPHRIDTDADGASDAMEPLRGTDPYFPDDPAGLVVSPGGGGIQLALMTAFEGETIRIEPGTYREALALSGKTVQLTGLDPNDPATVAATVIDATGRGPVVAWSGEIGPGAAISGLTLTHGRSAGDGAAIQTGVDAPIALDGDIVTSNTAAGDGAVAHLTGAIRNCTFERNFSANGGALAHCSGDLTESAFRANRARDSGGALFNCTGATTQCTFDDNFAGGNGGAMAQIFGLISGDTFTGNEARGQGGAISQGVRAIGGNVFIGNAASIGGALAGCNQALTGNQFTSNTADYGGAIADCRGLIQGNDFIGNAGLFSGGALLGCAGTIQDNFIHGNSGNSGGGLSLCSGPIRRNTISNNTVLSSGGAIASSSGEIADNLIFENRASDGGGLFDCDGWIHGNRIVHNLADDDGTGLGGMGGGLAGCDGRIELNRIESNRAFSGGGIDGAKGAVVNNWIQGNTAQFTGGGVHNANGELFGNLIAVNSAFYGGAVQAGLGIVRNNTVAGNFTLPGGYGGGLHNLTGAIENNIFWQNSNYAIYVSQQAFRPQSVRANDFWQNWDGPYVHLQWTVYATVAELDAALPEAEGNFELDPGFILPWGADFSVPAFDDNDFRLRPDSPLVDLGRAIPGGAPTAVDLGGDARIVAGRGGNGDLIDLGAYETYGVLMLAPNHPIQVEPGKTFAVQWRIHPLLAAAGLRFELWDGDLLAASLGADASQRSEGTAELTLPPGTTPGHPFALRGTSESSGMFWGDARGTVAALGPGERAAADGWRRYR